MTHSTISIQNLSLTFPDKICFEDFSTHIYPGDRIAIIGRNGSGKTSLLKILSQKIEATEGFIDFPISINIGYVEQTIESFDSLSGGQRFNKRLSEALANNPDILLLDEPTNHLDQDNRKSLMRMLNNYHGTLIMVSHDKELLDQCSNILWHIDNGIIDEFQGSYDHYMQKLHSKRQSLERKLTSLKDQLKSSHESLMAEQSRASKSKGKGEKSIQNRKWPTVTSKAKANRANKTSSKKSASINKAKSNLEDQLGEIYIAKEIKPNFIIEGQPSASSSIVAISNGSVGYESAMLTDIFLSVSGNEHIAIQGKNASGKSTLIKAILGDNSVTTSGSFHTINNKHIGYLDQHYSNLEPNLTVLEHLKKLRPDWDERTIRLHLNDFLFRSQKDVQKLASILSGGERARLSLCLIAAKTPTLLILDEITNNLDLETKEHVTQILKEYPGALIIISHDNAFLSSLKIDHTYEIKDGKLI